MGGWEWRMGHGVRLGNVPSQSGGSGWSRVTRGVCVLPLVPHAEPKPADPQGARHSGEWEEQISQATSPDV